MKSKYQLFEDLAKLDHLPTLPHILLKLIGLCGEDSPDLNAVAEIVEKDPALSATVIKLVNSAYLGLFRKIESVNQAVILVGSSGIRNMALCASILNAFPKGRTNEIFSLKRFWWHSLRCAVMAKHIAHHQEVGSPDEAFLAGLLHDIGKIVLWMNDKKEYETLLASSDDDTALMLAGESQIGATHAEVGAWLLERWGIETMVVDCVRYHHEPIERIVHSLGLVRLVHLANQLCKDAGEQVETGMADARSFFGFDTDVCMELMDQADQEAREVAALLEIDIDSAMSADGDSDEQARLAHHRLAEEVRNRSLALSVLDGFLRANDRGSMIRCMTDGLHTLLSVRRSLFFLVDDQKNRLVGYVTDKTGRFIRQPALSVDMNATSSLLISTLTEKCALDSFGLPTRSKLAIIDEQFVRFLGGSGILCLPIVAQDEAVGVLVAGIEQEDLNGFDANRQLVNLILHKGALALRLDILRRRELSKVRNHRAEAATDIARRVVHEINNPLGVIKNYLKVLSMKLEQSGIEHEEIGIINEEISRAARLLGKLTFLPTGETAKALPVALNSLLTSIVRLTKETYRRELGVQITTDLDGKLPSISANPDELKQVFLNLIKNAAEAMDGKGGNLSIRTRYYPAALGGQPSTTDNRSGSYIAIVFQDDGPGIPPAVRERLFEPYTSTKTGDHSGLGLSVVHGIITALGGSIDCESAPGLGTTFIIELPVG